METNMTQSKKPRTPMYQRWQCIKQRCYNPHSQDYKSYGGRGITMCAQWRDDFNRFALDMGDVPTKTSYLIRINLSKNYTKENCLWSTKAGCDKNRSMKVNLCGVEHTPNEWADVLEVNVQRIYRAVKTKNPWKYLTK